MIRSFNYHRRFLFLSVSLALCNYVYHPTLSHPLATVLLLGSVSVEAVTHIMLKHICHSELKPFSRYLCFLLTPLLAVNISAFAAPVVSEVQLLYFCCGVAVTVTSFTCMRVRQGSAS